MSDYTLDQLDSRIVSFKNGRWRFFVIRVISLPEGTCDAQHVIFGNLSRSGDVMRKRIPGDRKTALDKDLETMAGEADERELSTTGGRMIVRRSTDGSGNMSWIVRLEHGRPILTDIASGKVISELDDTELNAMAMLFRHSLSA